MVYNKFRLCSGCRTTVTNKGLEIGGIFFCEACASRRSASRISTPVVRVQRTSSQNSIAANQQSGTDTFAKVLIALFLLLIFSLSIRACLKEEEFTSQKTYVDQSVQSQTKLSSPEIEQLPPLSETDIQRAITDYCSGNFTKSIPLLARATRENHNAQAEYYLARAIKNGQGGLTRNLDLAIDHYSNSANNGFYASYNSLGVIYKKELAQNDSNKRTAYRYFQKGASFYDLHAMANFAESLATGYGTDKDINEAIKCNKKIINESHVNRNGISWQTANEIRNESLENLVDLVVNYWYFSSCDYLAKYLTDGLDNSYDRTFAIFRYITKTVSYDTTYRIRTAEDAFYTGSAVCQGYSLLMERMCEASGIQCDYISGYCVDESGNVDYSSKHAWNRIYDQDSNRYIYVDVTWASGYVTENNVFVR